MYECYICGCRFRSPDYKHWDENHGGGIYEPMCCMTCPECGSEDIDEVFDDEEEEE